VGQSASTVKIVPKGPLKPVLLISYQLHMLFQAYVPGPAWFGIIRNGAGERNLQNLSSSGSTEMFARVDQRPIPASYARRLCKRPSGLPTYPCHHTLEEAPAATANGSVKTMTIAMGSAHCDVQFLEVAKFQSSLLRRSAGPYRPGLVVAAECRSL
jgi:hypothetical protein